MKAGKLRHRISVYRHAEETGLAGDSTGIEIMIGQFWASVSPISSREIVASDQDFSDVTHEIRMRYCQDIRANQFARLGTQVFQFLHVQDWENRHIELKIIAREVFA